MAAPECSKATYLGDPTDSRLCFSYAPFWLVRYTCTYVQCSCPFTWPGQSTYWFAWHFVPKPRTIWSPRFAFPHSFHLYSCSKLVTPLLSCGMFCPSPCTSPSPTVHSKSCHSPYLYPVSAFSRFLHNTGTTSDWWEQLDLGSGCTVMVTVRCLRPAADSLHIEYIGVKCSYVLCMRVNTIMFCISFYCCHKLNATKNGNLWKVLGTVTDLCFWQDL